jgi:SAM-dependent methyltransferase
MVFNEGAHPSVPETAWEHYYAVHDEEDVLWNRGGVDGSLVAAVAAVGSSEPAGLHGLDVGCGLGHDALYMLLHNFSRVTCLDASRSALDHARSRIHGRLSAAGKSADSAEFVRAFLGENDEAPLGRVARYDLVWVRSVLQHLSDRDVRGMLRYLHSLLRPGGIVVIKEVRTARLSPHLTLRPSLPHARSDVRHDAAPRLPTIFLRRLHPASQCPHLDGRPVLSLSLSQVSVHADDCVTGTQMTTQKQMCGQTAGPNNARASSALFGLLRDELPYCSERTTRLTANCGDAVCASLYSCPTVAPPPAPPALPALRPPTTPPAPPAPPVPPPDPPWPPWPPMSPQPLSLSPLPPSPLSPPPLPLPHAVPSPPLPALRALPAVSATASSAAAMLAAFALLGMLFGWGVRRGAFHRVWPTAVLARAAACCCADALPSEQQLSELTGAEDAHESGDEDEVAPVLSVWDAHFAEQRS